MQEQDKSGAATKSARILVVEDNRVVREALSFQLGVAGYDVISVVNGSDAVQSAIERKPDLMILDLSLMERPGDSLQDGFAVLGWIRRLVPDSDFPVIIHTIDDSPQIDERARAEGVAAVLRKGDGTRKLLHAVQQAMRDFSDAQH
jgi:CheY-like chemotaxis protein